MKKLFLIGSLITLVAGILALILPPMLIGWDDLWVIYMSVGGVVAILGIIPLATGYTTPAVSKTRNGFIVGLLLIIGSVLVVAGVFAWELGGAPITIGGGAVVLISMIMWSCICCQGRGQTKTLILGIASGHESIAIADISREADVDAEIVKGILYDALGKKEIHGKIEGETFIRSVPPTTTYTAPAATGAAPTVLVICPYCGAKTEQGLAKCQKCGADL
jgi:hypothetical protein